MMNEIMSNELSITTMSYAQVFGKKITITEKKSLRAANKVVR
jgi:hypothetical protein